MAVDTDHIIGCLSLVYPTFVQQELAQLAFQSISVIQSAVDPISQLLDTNVSLIVDDINNIASQSAPTIFVALSATALGGLWDETLKKQLTEKLANIFNTNPENLTSFIDTTVNKGGQVVGLIHLFLSLSAEAPFALAQVLFDSAITILEQKKETIHCLQLHLIQLSNCLVTLGMNPVKAIVEIQATLDEAIDELKACHIDIKDVLFTMGKGLDFAKFSQLPTTQAGTFLTAKFGSAMTHLDNAGNLINPLSADPTILGIFKAVTKDAAGTEFQTKINRMTALYTAKSLLGLINVEFDAMKAQTDAVNFYLAQSMVITESLANVQQSSKVIEMRRRLLNEMDIELGPLIDQVVNARKDPDLATSLSLFALKWGSDIKRLRTLGEKVATADLSQAAATGTNIEALRKALLAVQNDIENLNIPPTILHGIEDLTTMTARMKTIGFLTNSFFDRIKDASTTALQASAEASLLNTLDTLVPLITVMLQDLNTSKDATDSLISSATTYAAVEIGTKQDILGILTTLDSLGLDRAGDLLRSGAVEEFFDADFSTLSYAGVVLKCLAEAAVGAPDQGSAAILQDLADEVRANYLNKLVLASDVFAGGRFQTFNDLRADMERIQSTMQTAKDLIARMIQLGGSASAAISETSDNVAGIGAKLSAVRTATNTEANNAMRKLTVKDLGPAPCDTAIASTITLEIPPKPQIAST